MPDWLRRTLFGVLFGVVVIGGTLVHPLVMTALWALIGLLIAVEFGRNEQMHPAARMLLAAGVVGTCLWAAASHAAAFVPWIAGGMAWLAVSVFLHWPDTWKGWRLWWWNALFLWGVMGLADPAGDFQPAMLLAVIFTVWTHDVAAYAGGNLFKGPKLAPSLSPGKRWSGALSGWLGGWAIGWLIFQWMTTLPPATSLASAAAAVAGAFIGDLIQSAWKRTLGIKDSGRILPGHGGILDRMDALMAAAPLAYLVIRWMQS